MNPRMQLLTLDKELEAEAEAETKRIVTLLIFDQVCSSTTVLVT